MCVWMCDKELLLLSHKAWAHVTTHTHTPTPTHTHPHPHTHTHPHPHTHTHTPTYPHTPTPTHSHTPRTHLFVCSWRTTVADVLYHCGSKQHWLLINESNYTATEPGWIQQFDWVIVNQNLPLVDVIEPLRQCSNSRLTWSQHKRQTTRIHDNTIRYTYIYSSII